MVHRRRGRKFSQYQDLDGANQQWQLVALGGGGTRTFTNPLSCTAPTRGCSTTTATTTWPRRPGTAPSPCASSRTLGGLATAAGHGHLQPDPAQRRRHHVGARVPPAQRAQRAALVPLLHGRRNEPYNLGTQRIHVLESAGLDPMGPYSFKADLLDPTQDNTWELDPQHPAAQRPAVPDGHLLQRLPADVHPAAVQPVDGQRHPAHPSRRPPTAGRPSAARSTRAPRSSATTARRSSSTRPATAPPRTTSSACSPTTAATRCTPRRG